MGAVHAAQGAAGRVRSGLKRVVQRFLDMSFSISEGAFDCSMPQTFVHTECRNLVDVLNLYRAVSNMSYVSPSPSCHAEDPE